MMAPVYYTITQWIIYLTVNKNVYIVLTGKIAMQMNLRDCILDANQNCVYDLEVFLCGVSYPSNNQGCLKYAQTQIHLSLAISFL